MKNVITILIALLPVYTLCGQFAPAAGETGSSAVYKDDIAFKGWAKGCMVTRGFINISDTTITFTQNQVTSNRAFFGDETMALGKPGGALDCISLGDGGSATLTFDFPIKNGAGADFAVFENAIKEQEPPFQYFLELAFVEVSTNGKRFVRFPAVTNVPATAQLGTFGQTDPTKIHNFAGKYAANYGTPFDLEDLKDSTGINLDSINYVRLVDVVGSIDSKFARYDSKGHIVNNPFPTEFLSCGFDLDAVGVINFNQVISSLPNQQKPGFKVYPNPVSSERHVFIEGCENYSIQLWSQTGKKIAEWQKPGENNRVDLPQLNPGLYFLSVLTPVGVQMEKLLVE